MEIQNKMEIFLEKINFSSNRSKTENISKNNLNEDKPISLKYQLQKNMHPTIYRFYFIYCLFHLKPI